MESARIEDFTLCEPVLAVSLELSGKCWKVALQDGRRERPAIHNAQDETPAARLAHVVALIQECKTKWQLPTATRTAVLYEAGQDGFWIQRALAKLGYEVLLVDPASIPVGRHARRAKTDRLDAIMLLNCLRAWLRGERDRMRVIRVPEPEAEARRHLVRDRGELQKEAGQHRDRIRKLLRTVGCWDEVGSDFAQRLERGEVRCFDGAPLPREFGQRLERECERLALVQQQFAALEKSLLAQLPPQVQALIVALARLKGVGWVGAMRLVLELFWRQFHNRREVGSCLGLVPQPYNSGNSETDQGISKQGNRRVRALMIEMAWMWLRYQPDSALARWFTQRTSGAATNKRGKRIAIVAVARRLAIALWRYLKDGVVPDGAQLKAV